MPVTIQPTSLKYKNSNNEFQTVTAIKGDVGSPGISPTVTVTDITNGHRVTITDTNGAHNFDVMDGEDYVLTAADKAEIAQQAVESISALQDGMAIVCNGNTHAAIPSGSFAYVRNHSSLAEGLYQAASAIAANATLSTSNLTAVSGGGLNRLAEYVTLYDNQNGIFYDETATLSEAITNFRYLLLVFRTNAEYATQLIPTDTIPVGRSISQSFLEHNVYEGQVTYPLYFSTSANFTITSATTIKCTMQVYTNSNLKARLTKVIGIGRIN